MGSAEDPFPPSETDLAKQQQKPPLGLELTLCQVEGALQGDFRNADCSATDRFLRGGVFQ
jgi:hypothetical protein